MATVSNLTKWALYSHALGGSIPAETTITDVDQDLAERICATGIFILGADEVVETPKRKARSTRGAVEVEEAVEGERETR